VQHALRTHPDKNPGNEDATAQFQRVAEAFKIIENHIKRPGTGFWYMPHAFDPFEGLDEEDIEDFFCDEFSDSDEYEYNYGYDSDSGDEYHGLPPSFMEYVISLHK
jgi:curved DNA-binding protein CbpA